MWLRFLGFPLALLAGVCAAAVLLLGLVIVLAYPNLPELGALTAYQPKIPLRIYTAEGTLLGEFGEERRAVVSIAEVPASLKNAIIAAEDERFYQHPGIDYIGVLRAAYANLVAGGRRQGASTITMQVARNFFLSSRPRTSASTSTPASTTSACCVRPMPTWWQAAGGRAQAPSPCRSRATSSYHRGRGRALLPAPRHRLHRRAACGLCQPGGRRPAAGRKHHHHAGRAQLLPIIAAEDERFYQHPGIDYIGVLRAAYAN